MIGMSELLGEFNDLKLGFTLRKDDDPNPPDGFNQDLTREDTEPEPMEELQP